MEVEYNTLIKAINKESAEEGARILLSGGIIGMPTETVYGLAGAGTNASAVNEIYRVKGRPSDNPLIAHVHTRYDLERLVYIEQPYIARLVSKYMPGPLTLVMKSRGLVCKEAVCGGHTLAVRMPAHNGCQMLLRAVDVPIVAPSANLSKHTSPVTAQQVYNDLHGRIPLILDGGKCAGGIESTVLDVTERVPRILRAGLVTKEMIAEVAGDCEIAMHKEGDKVRSPGVKYSHYRPTCRTALFNSDDVAGAAALYEREVAAGNRAYIMCTECAAKNFTGKNVLSLGSTGEEIAYNLYDTLLKAEKIADVLIAVDMPREDGVYLGITNRLRKACK